MRVYCIPNFKAQLLGLSTKKPYSAIIDDVRQFFLDKDIDELHEMRDIIQNSAGTYSLNKFRIANSIMSRGKSGSYRCICACFPLKNMIFLGAIYPKTGSDGVDNLSKEEYKRIAKEILGAISDKRFYAFDVETGEFAAVS